MIFSPKTIEKPNMKKTVLALAFAALFAFQLSAQTQQKLFTEADYQLCYRLFDAMQTRVTMDKTIETLVDSQIRNMPQMLPFRQTFLDFFRKYMAYDAMKKDMAEIYLREFKPEEIRELIRFYGTPIGRRLAAAQPVLAVEGARVGEDRVKAHQGELQQKIMEQVQKMKQVPAK